MCLCFQYSVPVYQSVCLCDISYICSHTFVYYCIAIPHCLAPTTAAMLVCVRWEVSCLSPITRKCMHDVVCSGSARTGCSRASSKGPNKGLCRHVRERYSHSHSYCHCCSYYSYYPSCSDHSYYSYFCYCCCCCSRSCSFHLLVLLPLLLLQPHYFATLSTLTSPLLLHVLPRLLLLPLPPLLLLLLLQLQLLLLLPLLPLLLRRPLRQLPLLLLQRVAVVAVYT